MIDIGRDLDLSSVEGIQVVQRTKDNTDLKTTAIEFSKEFTIPATQPNNEVFSYWGVGEVNDPQNPHKGIPAIWSFDTFNKFKGLLELRGIVYKNGKPYQYKCAFYGRARSLASIFADDTLRDIDWSAFDHELSYTNVTKSWNLNAGELGNIFALLDGDIFYPIIDYGQNYFIGPADLDTPGNIANANNGILLSSLKPAIKLRAMLETIFSNYGLTLTIDEGLEELYEGHVLGQSDDQVTKDAEFFDSFFVAGNNGGATQSISGLGVETRIDFQAETQDEQNQWNTTTSVFTAGLAGFWNIIGSVRIDWNGYTGFRSWRMQIKVNGVAVVNNVFSDSDSISDINLSTITTGPNAVFLQVGDEVEFTFTVIFTIGAVDIGGIYFSFQPPVSTLGETVSLTNQMPGDKVAEFLQQFIKAYNLRLDPVGDSDTEWRLTAYEDWLTEGTTRDWSNYLDVKNIVYDKRKVYKRIEFKHQESDAAIHEAFKAQAQRNFGDLQVRTGVDFGEDLLEVESPFTLIPPSLYQILDENGDPSGFWNGTLYKAVNADGQPVVDKFLFMRAHYTGQNVVNTPIYVQNGNTTGGTPTFIARTFISVYNAESRWDVESTSTHLGYSIESPYIGDVAENNSYTEFWKQTLERQFAANSRQMVKAKFFLPKAEFYKLELNDKIFCEKNYWYIDEMTYDTKSGEATATLILANPFTAPNIREIRPGGKVEYTRTPDTFEKSSDNVIEKGGSFFTKNLRTPLLVNQLVYTQARVQIIQIITNEINQIGGRLRIYGNDDYDYES